MFQEHQSCFDSRLEWQYLGSLVNAGAGIEVVHMIRKGQWAGPEGQAMSAAELFYSLAF